MRDLKQLSVSSSDSSSRDGSTTRNVLVEPVLIVELSEELTLGLLYVTFRIVFEPAQLVLIP